MSKTKPKASTAKKPGLAKKDVAAKKPVVKKPADKKMQTQPNSVGLVGQITEFLNKYLFKRGR